MKDSLTLQNVSPDVEHYMPCSVDQSLVIQPARLAELV